MSKKLRIGIIGTGGIAGAHMKAYEKFEDVEIVGGADIVPGKAREFLDKWNLKDAQAFNSAEEVRKTHVLYFAGSCGYGKSFKKSK